jgi:hypothetical protein
MGSFLHLALAYVLGGLTFLPLLVLLVFAHAYYTQPVVDPAAERQKQHDALGTLAEGPADLSKLPVELQKPDRERDAAAGYFAISREYVAGGVNGKPPERLTPAGEVIATESPSVYQSMYRSIFERGKAQGPSFEATGGSVRATKKTRNVFYVVLRLGHLMLYDNADQLEVRHVISLGLYDVDVYGGGEQVPEGELWVRRNCIRLKRRETDYTLRDSKPYYLFSDNCSEKEDFYHALIQNQHRASTNSQEPVVPLKFESEHMIKLVQQLHGSEELMQSRWFNALLGRIFLSLYKTNEVHSFIHAKIMKKLTRIQVPSFIEQVKVGRIDMGSAAPLFTNQKLRELTLDGELVLEMDVKYSGNFRLEIAAQVLIDLGKRFNVRRLDILLSGMLKTLEGHLLIKVKPPPCNRLWISFETMPKLDLSIEPIVSSRQITYGIILRTIESKIREVMGETLVFPNWDDIPFSHSEGDPVRGGLWEFHAAGYKPSASTSADAAEKQEREEGISHADQLPKSQSTPSLVRRRPVGASTNGKAKSIKGSVDNTSISSGHESPVPRSKPKAARSTSFNSASPPLVSMSPTHASAFRDDGQGSLPDAASSMKDLSSRSSSTSSTPLPLEAQALEGPQETEEDRDPKDSEDQDVFNLEMPADDTPRPSDASQKSRRNSSKTSINIEGFGSPQPDIEPPKRTKTLVAGAQVATAAARRWGYDFVTKRASTMPHNQNPFESTPELSSAASVQSMPIGRGQPLPPPGQPLPGPPGAVRKGWTSALGSIGRKKVPMSSHNPSVSSLSSEAREAAFKAAKDASEATPPLPPRRSAEMPTVPSSSTLGQSRRVSQHSRKSSSKALRASLDEGGVDNVLVIKAPETEGDGEASEELEKTASEATIGPLEDEGTGMASSRSSFGELKTETSLASSPASEDGIPLEVEDKTPTRKNGLSIGKDEISEEGDTKKLDRDSLEMLQTLVH